MRSTAFISLLSLASPSLAAAEAPTPGCYRRDYGPEHLVAHPDQVVASLRLHIEAPAENGEALAKLGVVLADQGRARAEGLGGANLSQTLVCGDWGEGPACGVECDGGRVLVTQDAEGVTLTTDRLLVGKAEDCTGSFDLAERPGVPVRYRLERLDPAACGAG